MNRTFLKVAVLLSTILACASFLPANGQDASKRKMTNQDVLDMVSLGLGDDVILEKIRSAPETDFTTDLESLKALKAAHVSDPVIHAMINPKAAAAAPAASAAAPGPAQPTKSEAIQEQKCEATQPAKAGPQVVSLKQVKTVYVEPMANDLDQFIRAEISKQMQGRLTVTVKQEEADACLVGTGEWKKGTGAAITGRWLGLHDTATGAVSLVPRNGSTVLWASEAGDRSIWWGVLKRGGPRKVADRLIHNLKSAVEQAK